MTTEIEMPEFRKKLRTEGCHGLTKLTYDFFFDESGNIREIIHEYFYELGLGRVDRHSINKTGDGREILSLYWDWKTYTPVRHYELLQEVKS